MLKYLIIFCLLAPSLTTRAEESTVKENVQEAGRDANRGIKKGTRAVQDETCQMIKGKMECMGQKVKHKAQNTVDDVKDKADDIKK